MSETVADAFTSYEYDDAIGPIKRNATDGLFAIAEAINRLAISQENLLDAQRQAFERSAQSTAMMMAMVGGERPGHA